MLHMKVEVRATNTDEYDAVSGPLKLFETKLITKILHGCVLDSLSVSPRLWTHGQPPSLPHDSMSNTNTRNTAVNSKKTDKAMES